MKKEVPKPLRIWFLIHFIIDMIFAIPLIFFPAKLFSLIGIQETSFITARLVGAALIGIGGASLFNYKKTIESYDIMLTLKILWSGAAILGLGISLFLGAPKSVWIILITFVLFSLTWIYYKYKIYH